MIVVLKRNPDEKQLNNLASGENAQPAGPDPKNEQER